MYYSLRSTWLLLLLHPSCCCFLAVFIFVKLKYNQRPLETLAINKTTIWHNLCLWRDSVRFMSSSRIQGYKTNANLMQNHHNLTFCTDTRWLRRMHGDHIWMILAHLGPPYIGVLFSPAEAPSHMRMRGIIECEDKFHDFKNGHQRESPEECG